MKNELYPLKFKPILKEKIWGGKKLSAYLHKNTTSEITGESWEISAVNSNVSEVVNGPLAQQSLTDLITKYGEELVGKQVWERFAGKFPLLFKFIDAKENLSLQLHPDDQLALKRHDSFGKTEMWYIMQADENAGIYVGFKEGTDKESYLRHLEKGELQHIMNFEKVKTGDVFFIKPGLVHAIGKGVVLAEIQQSSDITYRVFDWNRRDKAGNERELHTELAIDAIDFDFEEFQVNYENTSNDLQLLVDNTYFKTKKVKLEGVVERNYEDIDSFAVLMCVEGTASVKTNTGELNLEKGETALLPASTKKAEFKSQSAEILEVTV